MIRRLTVGDFLIGMALLSFALALAAPTLRARAFRSTLDGAVASVDSLGAASERVRRQTGAWPRPVPPGEVPPEVSRVTATDFGMVRDEYVVEWSALEVVEQVEAPATATAIASGADAPPPDSVGPELISVVREVGGVVIHSASDALLAELLARYGSDVSFVRDSTWTLIVEPGATR